MKLNILSQFLLLLYLCIRIKMSIQLKKFKNMYLFLLYLIFFSLIRSSFIFDLWVPFSSHKPSIQVVQYGFLNCSSSNIGSSLVSLLLRLLTWLADDILKSTWYFHCAHGPSISLCPLFATGMISPSIILLAFGAKYRRL